MSDLTPAEAIFSRDPRDPTVLVADGYGLSLTVNRGHLTIGDGLGRHRRERRLSRAQRTVRRIVILGHTGHFTLDAIRWCHDTGITIVHLDTDGTTLLTAGKPGVDAAWSTTATARFAERDAETVPDHWTVFGARGSPLHRGGRSPRNAADPINALLNYGYALAEAEARLAAIAVGLDPGLGIVHTDHRNRDSLALDLLEALRPVVERHVLRLLVGRYFRADDFHETRHGACRLLPPLTHQLAEQLPVYAREVARHAEAVSHLLARSSPGKIEMRTPLSRDNTIAAQSRGARTAKRRPTSNTPITPTCRTCGVELSDRARQLCPACWPVTRGKLAAARATAGNEALAGLRARGEDPSNTPQAAAKRSASLSRRKREQLAWQPGAEDGWTLERYLDELLPRLAHLPLSTLQQATGLFLSACSRIRSGTLTPHRRHWQPLRKIA